MDKQEILNCLKSIYQRAFDMNDMHLCLEILQEIINVKQMNVNI